MVNAMLSQASTNPSEKVRVMIVDDSAFMRFTLTQQLNEHPAIQVVGSASNGREALKLIPELQPDVITLDVEMPKMDGLTTLGHIMTDFPRPVIMFSSLTREGTAETIRALMLGAVDFIAKPDNRVNISEAMKEMVDKILGAARAKVKPVALQQPVAVVTQSVPRIDKPTQAYKRNTPVVLIGSSTGGPGALNEIIPALPSSLASPVVLVQHMPAGFTHSLSERLNSISALKVKEAEPGDSLMVGQVLVAPGGFHMVFDEEGRVALNQRRLCME
ncbi:MAG TPA: chemotaxis protein CheB [Anaerolineales bacterium]|nr:chemotaxis protein CheB [Anaerolineales bacterium]